MNQMHSFVSVGCGGACRGWAKAAPVLLMLAGAPLYAAVELDPIYGDGMVLQQGREIVVRGTTDKPSEPVKVSFNGQTV